MLRAADSGAARKQQAQSTHQRQHLAGQAQAQNTAQMASSLVNQDRQLDEQNRSNVSRENLAKRGQDIQMAQAGLESELDPRAQKLQEDMQRGLDQGSKPLEFSGERIVPGTERKQASARKQALDEFRAGTERLKAEAYREQVAGQANRAQAAGDMKQFKAKMEELARPIQSKISTLNNAMSTNLSKSQSAMAKLKERYANEGIQDPEVMAALNDGVMNPALRRFLQNEIMTDNVKVMASTGELPVSDTSEIDFASPMMQAVQTFSGVAVNVASALGIMVDSWQERNRMINKVSASMALGLFSGRQNQGEMIGPAEPADPNVRAPGVAPEAAAANPPQTDPGLSDEQIQQPHMRSESPRWGDVR